MIRGGISSYPLSFVSARLFQLFDSFNMADKRKKPPDRYELAKSRTTLRFLFFVLRHRRMRFVIRERPRFALMELFLPCQGRFCRRFGFRRFHLQNPHVRLGSQEKPFRRFKNSSRFLYLGKKPRAGDFFSEKLRREGMLRQITTYSQRGSAINLFLLREKLLFFFVNGALNIPRDN